jgi:hypothetical protein
MFACLLVVMVVTMVLTIGNMSFFGNDGVGEFKTREFYGYNIANEDTKTYLERAAEISAMLSRENVMEHAGRFSLEDYAKERAVGLSLAAALGIREPSDEVLRDYVRGMSIFQDENGAFSPSYYTTFVQMFRAQRGIPESSLRRILSEDYRISEVRKLLGGAGFVVPDAVALQVQAANTTWSFDVATAQASEFKPAIEPTAEELAKFFEDNKALFEIPELIQLVQIRFPIEAYASLVPMPTDEQVQAFFERNKARYAAAPQEGAEPAEPVLDEPTKLRVVTDMVRTLALQFASDRANDYSMALWNEQLTKDSPRITDLAAQMGAQIVPMPPFAKEAPLFDRDIDPAQLVQQWSLVDSERCFSDVLVGRAGASVLIYQGLVPSRMPEFSEIESSVREAFVQVRTRELFHEHCTQLREKAAAAVAEGKTFSEVATAMGMQVASHTSLKVGEIPQEYIVQGGPADMLVKLEPGDVSPMQMTESGAYIVHLAAKEVPPMDLAALAAEDVAMFRQSTGSVDGWMTLVALMDKRDAELDAELESGEAE